MFAVLSVDGTIAEMPDDAPESISLVFDTDAAATHRCRACGDELTETTSSYENEEGDTVCLDSEQRTGAGSDDGQGPHDPEPIPVSWCNSAAIHADASDDSVTVSISVGDPRGAFTLTVRRVPDDADGDLAGHLIMHTPYAAQPAPHMALTPLHDGTYVVGTYSPTRRACTVPPAA